MGSNGVVYKTTVVFAINDFTDALKTLEDDDQICSEEMTIGSDKCQAMVALGEKEGEEYVEVGLRVVATSGDAVDADFMAFIRDSDHRDYTFTTSSPRREFEANTSYCTQGFAKRSLLLDQMDKHLPNNTLTLEFRITVYKGIEKYKNKAVAERRQRFENTWLYARLWNCTFVVGGKEFIASKAMLSDRSQVFYDMFIDNMHEKSSVVIDDIHPTVFEQFHTFLHYGSCLHIETMVEELLYASDKYTVPELKTICENLYYLSINSRNAFQVLDALKKYGNKKLVSKTIKYIKRNWNQCLETEWRKLGANDNKLFGKLFDGIKSCNTETLTLFYTYKPNPTLLHL